MLSLIGYSSELSEMDEAEKLHPSYDIPHNDWLADYTTSILGGSLYYNMCVLFNGAVVCASMTVQNKYKKN